MELASTVHILFRTKQCVIRGGNIIIFYPIHSVLSHLSSILHSPSFNKKKFILIMLLIFLFAFLYGYIIFTKEICFLHVDLLVKFLGEKDNISIMWHTTSLYLLHITFFIKEIFYHGRN